MNENDLVYKIAERVKRLLDENTLFGLQSQVAGPNAITPHAIRADTRGKSKGELIEEIITDEFIEEFPGEIIRS